MRVVADTNVLVSGLISPFGPPGVIVGLVARGALQLCYDARIIAEYRAVLERPAFAFRLRDIETLLSGIGAGGVSVAPAPLPGRLPDAGDVPFLEVAVSVGAAFLVTGNLKHFPPDRRHGIRVVSPREFLDAGLITQPPVGRHDDAAQAHKWRNEDGER